jgi:AraC family transcriptional regulator
MKEISNRYLREEYISRINRVTDYIEKNFNEELTLEKLAETACFSKFHFHRIFAAMTGETINQFILRLRTEKAASVLINNPKKSITEIAFDFRFSSSAVFARTFKNLFGMTPSEWRESGCYPNSNHCITKSKQSQTKRNTGKEFKVSSIYLESVNINQKWRIEMIDKQNMQIEVKEMPEFHVAYVRNVGPYKGDSTLFEKLFGRLAKWGGPRGVFNNPDLKVFSVYHDDPEITSEDKLRLSACITVPKDTKVEGEIGKMTIAGGKYAVARFELAGSDEYGAAWKLVMGDWFPQSGYQPDDNPCYEIYHNNPKEHPEGIHIVDICVPVKPL